ncbi:multicopper oxidase domain-containing protein [Bacillus spizizenii]|uniref:multicopper oxidase domain-containing protein n=1 Tax=Bacillus spizizenii TaxID=96241 RepID=UPI0002D51EE2|nr:multicopper oxidase domain-containing protein [Bacillus spizizenii]
MLRKYHVVAIPIRIVMNKYGDHDPNGMMYVLKENEEKVKRCVAKNPFMPVDLVEPLTIRANVGDEVEILFENQLPFNTSMHIQSAEYNVQTSDGAFVGCNKDSTAPPCPPGGIQVYHWEVFEEGIHIFTDLGNPLSSELGSNIHGLFGSLIVEAAGSWWTDPITGEPINSGVSADIHHPFLPSFRELAWFFHDETEVKNLAGQTPIGPHTLQPESTFPINYRSEPHRNRVNLVHHGVVCPDCDGEEVHHDSWTFGDPDTPILRAYRDDPIKIRLIHGGTKETHTFHWHVHQWQFEENDKDSDILDVQAVSPQNSYTIAVLYGSGSLHGSFGDAIIHCHLYPHFTEGMWGLHRTFNTLQDGSQCYPNGVPIAALQPLPDREPPPRPNAERPGFPNFIPGSFGCKAPRPPLGIEGGRPSTELEVKQFDPRAVPGAAFTNPCPPGAPVRDFDIVLVQMPIVYNKEGWHDPQGRLYLLAEDEEDVLSGRKPPEPLTIRANAGECVRIRFTNKLPETIGGDAFQLVIRTYEAGLHVHFVKFDALSADGSNVGWNYDTSVLPGQTIHYQWFADVELKATFFHDHLFANEHQQHGVFASVLVEARGSTFLDNKTGKEIQSGTQAMIMHPYIPDFRELMLQVHDFSLLFDKDGCPLNPPPFPSSHDDPGVMGINYRNEPLQFRLKQPGCDPAYVFSSYVHGDPVTPILSTYNGDPVRIRLIQGAHEESHSFNLHRMRWHRERADLDSDIVQQQHIGIAEAFTFEFFMDGKGDFDTLYHFGALDDLWLGLWGLLRSYQEYIPELMPLPDQPFPKERTKELPCPTGELPPPANSPGQPCETNAPVRKFEVVALQADIVYNKYGDHDPHGIVFALAEKEEDIRSGTCNPEPLILRANVGDCVEITLHNKLDPDQFHNKLIHEYPEVPVEAPFAPSCRISMHPQLVEYDVLGSDGATVGFNPDQTVGPGECITYRWFIDQDVGACNLWDMADLRNHRHHGAFGMLITEPQGSAYLDPITRKEVNPGGQEVIISHPFIGEYREFAIIMHDGARLLDANNNLILDPQVVFADPESDEIEDFEDQGSRGFNYRNERFSHRLAQDPDVHKVFSSKVHGDPSTPIFYAYPDDPIKVRFILPADRARAHTFLIHGHKWQRSRNDLNSEVVSMKGQNIAGSQDTFELINGAGGHYGTPGDYMYRSGNIRWDIELGLWGIIRVLDEIKPDLLAPLKTADGGIDNE